MDVKQCDRCHRCYPPSIADFRLYRVTKLGLVGFNDLDLCGDCYNRLLKFLKVEEVTDGKTDGGSIKSQG